MSDIVNTFTTSVRDGLITLTSEGVTLTLSAQEAVALSTVLARSARRPDVKATR